MKIKNEEFKALQSKGFFTDAQATITPNNAGLPAGLLSALSTQIVENVLAVRTGEEALGGKAKLIDWAEQEYLLPFVEKTGQTQPYGDYAQPLVSSMNTSFNRQGHYRFSAKYLYGNLEAEQYAKARLDYPSIVLSSVMEALRVEENRTAFEGYIDNTSGQFLCYGLLNNPQLPSYETVLAKDFATMTWEEVLAFFGGAISSLTTNTGNNINGQSKIRVVISASAYANLVVKHTSLGISLIDTISKTYPNMYFVPAIEFDGAYQSENVIYFIGESPIGGVADTTILGYSEFAKMGNVILGDNSLSQSVSAGTIGAVVYKPFMVLRYYGA